MNDDELQAVDGRSVRLKDPVRERRLFLQRALAALIGVFAGFTALLTRLGFLQVSSHEHFTTLADSNRVKLRPLPPTRGLIFDRHGGLLADNLFSRHLEITPDEVKDLEATLTELGQRIELSETDLDRFRRLVRRSPPYNGIPLRFKLTDADVARLGVDLYRFPGVEIKADLTRTYPLGARAGHVVGYVGRIDENDLKRIDISQYGGTSHIGKSGVEEAFEELLHGQVGYQEVETNADGRPLRLLKQVAPVPGRNLYLTLNLELQAVAEQALEGHNGAVVALDPRTGEILAMVSIPTYDPNPFVNGIDAGSYRALRDAPDRPLYNRALRGVYPPGSTIKPLVALAGLETGATTASRTIHCRGSYSLPGQSHRFRDWKHSGHGAVNLDRAISQSCDVYFYDLALRLGMDPLQAYLTQFALGRPTGIDLKGEKGGLVPTEEWKQRVRKQEWFAGETLIAGIGQGYMLTTPLQLAHAIGVLAQRGQGFQPRLLHATEERGGEEIRREPPRPLPPVAVHNPRHWDAVIQGMVHVVSKGTAYKIGIGSRYTIAGKTGTAQVFSLGQNERYNARRLAKNLQDHALFIAFAPAEDPRIAVAVVAEHGGGGSATAAPIAKKVMDAYLLHA